MERIDAHTHFWNYSAQAYPWIQDNMSDLRKDFMPVDLYPMLKQSEFSGCIAVQARASEEETNFLISLASNYKFIKGVVGWVSTSSPDLEEKLQRYKQYEVLKGFRHFLQGDVDRNSMLSANFGKAIELFTKYDFTYDLLILPDQLQYAVQLAKDHTGQRFVIDHLAKPNIRESKIRSWASDVYELSKCPNVYCKLSGLVTEARSKTWTAKNFTPYINAVLKFFGPERTMFGSDWPVCLTEATFETSYKIIQKGISNLPHQEQQSVFGGTAKHFYNL